MKIRIGIFRLFLGITILFGVFLPAKVFGEERIYSVQKGETFYSIARTLGINVNELMKYNGITDPARLQAGQRIKIPVPPGQGASVPASQSGQTIYRVVRGDTFYGIARKYSVSVEAIRKENNLAANYVLKEGDALRLPKEARLPLEAKLPLETGVAAADAAAGSGSQGAVGNTTVVNPLTPPATARPAAIDSSVSWPVIAREISYMTGKLSGVVITGTRTEAVKSLTWGTVLSAGPYRGFGRVVIVQVEGGYLYVYGGCESLSVKEGDKVGPGTELGVLGVDAVSSKPQLFFMVYRSNAPIDPAKAPRA